MKLTTTESQSLWHPDGNHHKLPSEVTASGLPLNVIEPPCGPLRRKREWLGRERMKNEFTIGKPWENGGLMI